MKRSFRSLIWAAFMALATVPCLGQGVTPGTSVQPPPIPNPVIGQPQRPATTKIDSVSIPVATIVPPYVATVTARPLSVSDFRLKTAEAQRLMKSKPDLTAYSSTNMSTVTLAALEPGTSNIHLITLSKESFLSRGTQLVLGTSRGRVVRLTIVRANGVNTAVTIIDEAGKAYSPLTVEYPIEKFGSFREVAYYTSAHPALLSPEIVKSGQSYIRNMIDLAEKRLKAKGFSLSPTVLDVAERLCVVEHTDHDRFRKENRLALFEEVFSLYSLNQLDTYRYSVSSAGAGGMVQMIPSTYQMVRQLYPAAGLNPDFVLGMKNHGNALEAMLLYMQFTWNNLVANSDISDALTAKMATPAELLSAGYNSNPAKLPGYIRRGGTGWRTLIPRETQMYLQIYQSLDSLIPMKLRATPTVVTPPSVTRPVVAMPSAS